MSKHTPGPHRFTPFTGADRREGYAILSENPEVGRGYGVMWVETCQFPNAEHDGPLFAAASDLLTVCKMIVDAVDDGDEMAVVDAARAAIARATGKE